MGSPRRCRRACFHARARPIRPVRPPGVLHLASLSVRRRLFRAPSRSPLPRPFGRGACQGSFPRHDITRARPPVARAPGAPLRSVLRRSQPLDGLRRSPAPGLVSSPSRVQGSIPSRGFSLHAAPLSRREELPPCRSAMAGSPNCGVRRPPVTAPASGPRSARSSVRDVEVMNFGEGRSPPRVLSPPGQTIRREPRLPRVIRS